MDKPIAPVLVSSLNATARAQCPSSQQIRAGLDQNNIALDQYKKSTITTDKKGYGTIFFNDLKPGSVYNLYLTASSILPYEPTMLWGDS